MRQATLNNWQDIQRKRVKIGARVWIRRSNEVIPEIMGRVDEFVEGERDVVRPEVCPACGARVKPDVVLYEESLDQRTIESSVRAIAAADLLIVAGTSLTVYPAAGLINYYRGSRLVLINRDATPYDTKADLVLHDSLGQIFSRL